MPPPHPAFGHLLPGEKGQVQVDAMRFMIVAIRENVKFFTVKNYLLFVMYW